MIYGNLPGHSILVEVRGRNGQDELAVVVDVPWIYRALQG